MERRLVLQLIGLSMGGSLAHVSDAHGQHMPQAAPAPTAPGLQGPDATPHIDDIKKYAACAYCGMHRRTFHHSRMLIQYGDGTVDPLCSLRCAVSSLTVHLGKMPVAIWVADNAYGGDPKPLIDAETAFYLVGSSMRGVMTKRSKVAYGTRDAAGLSMATNGGEILNFDAALLAAYTDVAESVSRYLKTNADRLKRAGKTGTT